MATDAMSLDMSSESFWSYASLLRDSGTLCDIQLTVRDGWDNGEFVSLPAHKLILAAGSVYFRACLDRGDLLDIYNFDGISLSNLRTLLDYLYRRISWQDMQVNAEAAVAARTLGISQHSNADVEVRDSKKVLLVRRFDPSGNLIEERRGNQQRQKRPRTVLSNEEIAKIVVNRRHMRNRATAQKVMEVFEDSKPRVDVMDSTTYVQYGKDEQLPSQTSIHNHIQPEFQPSEEHQGDLLSTVATNVTLAEFTEDGINISQSTTDIFLDAHAEEILHDESKPVSHISNYYDDQMEKENLENLKAELGEIYVTQDADTFDSNQETLMNGDSNDRIAPVKNAQLTGQYPEKLTSVDKDNVEIMVVANCDAQLIAQPLPEIPVMMISPKKISSEEAMAASTIAQSVGGMPISDQIYQWAQPSAKKRPKDLGSPEKCEEYATVVKRKCDDNRAISLVGEIDGENEELTEQKIEEEVDNIAGMTSSSHTDDKSSMAMTEHENGTITNSQVPSDPILRPAEASQFAELVMVDAKKMTIVQTDEAVSACSSNKKSVPCVCSFCGRVFKNITGQRNHENWIHRGLRIREGSSPQSCQICNRVFGSYPALRNHETRRHGLVREWSCDVCNTVYKSKMLLRQHQRRKHEQQLFECDQCAATFKSREGWKIHMYKKHSDDAPTHMCDICGKVFKMIHELRIHCKLTHSTHRDFPCQLCTRSFKNNVSLTRHLRTYHSNERNHECDVCKSRFKTPHDMRKHRDLHFREAHPLNSEGRRTKKHPDGLEYPCSFCGKVFKKHALAVTHEKMQHHQKSDGVHYVCTICNKAFAIKHYLMQHINNKHRPRRFKCAAGCGREFAQPYELRRHQSQPCQAASAEAKVKPYRCCYCGHGFTLKGNLTKHLQNAGRCLRSARQQQVVDYVVMVDNKDGEIVETMADQLASDVVDGMVVEDVDLQTVHALQLLQCTVPETAASQNADHSDTHPVHIQPDMQQLELAEATDNILIEVAVSAEVEVKQEMT